MQADGATEKGAQTNPALAGEFSRRVGPEGADAKRMREWANLSGRAIKNLLPKVIGFYWQVLQDVSIPDPLITMRSGFKTTYLTFQ